MKKFLLFFFLVGVAAFALYAFQGSDSLSQNQKEKVLENLLGRRAVLGEKEASGWVQFTGKYVSFVYPANSVVNERHNEEVLKNPAVIEYQRFQTADGPIMQVQVAKIQSEDPDEITGIRLRRSQKNVYEESAMQIGGEEALVFKKSDRQSEIVAFILLDEKLYSLVVVGSNADLVKSIFYKVAESISFSNKPISEEEGLQ